MATTKKVDETIENAYDPNELVDVKIPRGSEKDDPNEYISVNDKTFIAPKGKTVKLPRYIAEEWERCQRAKERYYETVDRLLDTSNQK